MAQLGRDSPVKAVKEAPANSLDEMTSANNGKPVDADNAASGAEDCLEDLDERERRVTAQVIEDEVGSESAIPRATGPHDQPSRAGQRERIEFAVFLLRRQLYKSDVKRMMRVRYPRMSVRSIERYLSRARQVLVEEYKEHSTDPKQESLMFWQSLISGPDTDLRTKMIARERLDKLLGVDRRVQDQAAGRSGEHPSVDEMLVTTRQEASQILAMTRNARPS